MDWLPSSTYSSPLSSSLDWDISTGDDCCWCFFHFVSDSSVFSVPFIGCVLGFPVVTGGGGSTVSASSVGSNASDPSHTTIKPGSVLSPFRRKEKKKKWPSKNVKGDGQRTCR